MNRNGVIWTMVVQIDRVTDLQGQTVGFDIVRTGAGDYQTVSGRIGRDHMPPFEGDSTWAEVQKIAAKPWAFYRVVRLVDPPAF